MPLQRFHILFFQKAFDALFGFLAAAFADDSQRAARFVFWNQPVEIRRVVGHEPHARGIGAAILREASRWLAPAERFQSAANRRRGPRGWWRRRRQPRDRRAILRVSPPVSTSRRKPREFGPSPRKRRVKGKFGAGFGCFLASAGINRARSMIRSGRRNATSAERPSVNSSKRRISLTMLEAATSRSCSRKWWVTISERGAGSKPGLGVEHPNVAASRRHFCRGQQVQLLSRPRRLRRHFVPFGWRLFCFSITRSVLPIMPSRTGTVRGSHENRLCTDRCFHGQRAAPQGNALLALKYSESTVGGKHRRTSGSIGRWPQCFADLAFVRRAFQKAIPAAHSKQRRPPARRAKSGLANS